MTRFLTTERKQAIKYQVKLFGRATLTIWAIFGLLFLTRSVLEFDRDDLRYPSPPGWTWLTIIGWHHARRGEKGDEKTGFVDWPAIAQIYSHVLMRLEDPELDGAGLQPILKEDGEISVAGVGKTGLDISARPEAWRRGYYQVLMGMARTSENVEKVVKDAKRLMMFPADTVVGPSNPHPRQPHRGAEPPPLEEDVQQAFESPHVYYSKLLTTNGFTNGQRLEAALAYGDWLDFKGLSDTAEDVFDWGLDIAMGGLPQGINEVVDIRTGIISNEASYVSSNMLMATTALASHHARHGDLAAALPIFASILRARKQLPKSSTKKGGRIKRESTWSTIWEYWSTLFSRRPFPPQPPNGDEMPERSDTSICEEAGLMSNIGETLFASTISKSAEASSLSRPLGTSSKKSTKTGHLRTQEEGLSWTREAVYLAESTLESAAKNDRVARRKCSECLGSAMDNWATMARSMLKDEQAAKQIERPKKNWFWGSSTPEDESKWEFETQIIQEKLRTVSNLLSREDKQLEQRDFYHFIFGR
ncbi:uncharacterized protein KY384_001117 [Bacidia gigantensis]|uniref:uncharacterized protein n=1 Tax=Bacidia gigantensis TaxID=2732470 RepID=UPI001D03A6F7|nr:uncharacterized protein KY384_001117 [Bacidia gigantensis]KAG8534273.1 hypothetical protein KY384_001117 [Bacidia gigantensis]